MLLGPTGTSEQSGIMRDMDQRTDNKDYLYHLFPRADRMDMELALSHSTHTAMGCLVVWSIILKFLIICEQEDLNFAQAQKIMQALLVPDTSLCFMNHKDSSSVFVPSQF